MIVFLLLAAVILGGSYYAYNIAFYSPAQNREKIPEIKGPV